MSAKRKGSVAVWSLLIFLFSCSVYAIPLPTIVVVSTGGTISMKVDPESGGPVPALRGEDLIQAVPELEKMARIRVVNFSNIPSDYMDGKRWMLLSRRVSDILSDPEVSGVIITHGTDTLEETAYFLDLTLGNEKPVVLIGAQRNASEKDTDGPRNLLNAVHQILDEKSVGRGVTVTFNHYINAARPVTKTHSSNVQTFESGNYGYLGYVDSSGVVFFNKSLRRQTIPLPTQLPRVDLIDMYAGADGALLKHAVDFGAEGIVVAALGSGNVNESMYEAIQYALRRKVPVVISSRSYFGRVLPVYGFKGGGATLKEIGCVFADDLSPWKARVLLMLTLPLTKGQAGLQSYFDN